MKEYEIHYFKTEDKTKYIIFSTSYISPLKFISDIEKDLVMLNNAEKIEVIFDLLLSSGNGKERYGKAIFNGSRFDLKSFKYIEIPKNSCLRKVSTDYYREKSKYIESSMLNSIQKKMICNGIAI
ncbi:MAG: type II toxin-antitoxin system RnlB family antitoxin [Terrisporobacter othiniensis]|uniref:type II toxin-antitoxin system RnlB family antitoxin n=1 Tax=Terrisporobacter othiniensis TaxID=1577792 RepID=UPI002A75F48E|nr:type II toxin-antitoxin system RnlB family antitoxin [Terrisporobacter othiniensis]MDY3374195.1 type II toxin-antitoxin system RnlB family antitoxin [Terrisporobacter othiniensis]